MQIYNAEWRKVRQYVAYGHVSQAPEAYSDTHAIATSNEAYTSRSGEDPAKAVGYHRRMV